MADSPGSKPGSKPQDGEKDLSLDGYDYIDYKNTDLLLRFLNEQGKILPRRITGTTAKQQRQLSSAIKRARHLALISFVSDTVK